MKIERINDNMIKVTISLNDLEERDIDLDTLNYNSPAAQELFWDMMEKAEIEFGFNISDSQLVIEPIPDSEDGFIITITSIDEDGDFESIHKYIKNRFRKSDLKVKKKNPSICSTLMIYAFKCFDDLVDLCTRIVSVYTGDSSVYKYKNTYYLVLTKNSFTVADNKLFDIMLSEYGDKITNTAFFEGYLSEYGARIISHGAIDTISSYFK